MPKLWKIFGIAATTFVVSCDRSTYNSEASPSAVTQLAPAASVRDIRDTFEIRGNAPVSIVQLRHVADQIGLQFEQRPRDRTLMSCVLDDQEKYELGLFMSGLDERMRMARRYVVAYRDDGTVLCIETRHEHAGAP
jgi:hypothetical protein